jgi:hypothetical protein
MGYYSTDLSLCHHKTRKPQATCLRLFCVTNRKYF